MQIIMDGDAMPRSVRDILCRAAERRKIYLHIVSNSPISYPKSCYISAKVVSQGPDEADDAIVEMVEKGDLVITADVPLADRVVTKGGTCIDPRGELLTSDNIKERLSLRDLMSTLRDSGIKTSGPSAYSDRDRQKLANQLDTFLTRNINKGT